MLLEELFPPDVLWQVAEDWMWNKPLCSAEEALIDKAVEQMLLAQGDDGQLPYWEYIDKCKFRLAAVLA